MHEYHLLLKGCQLCRCFLSLLLLQINYYRQTSKSARNLRDSLLAKVSAPDMEAHGQGVERYWKMRFVSSSASKACLAISCKQTCVWSCVRMRGKNKQTNKQSIKQTNKQTNNVSNFDTSISSSYNVYIYIYIHTHYYTIFLAIGCFLLNALLESFEAASNKLSETVRLG